MLSQDRLSSTPAINSSPNLVASSSDIYFSIILYAHLKLLGSLPLVVLKTQSDQITADPHGTGKE